MRYCDADYKRLDKLINSYLYWSAFQQDNRTSMLCQYPECILAFEKNLQTLWTIYQSVLETKIMFSKRVPFGDEAKLCPRHEIPGLRRWWIWTLFSAFFLFLLRSDPHKEVMIHKIPSRLSCHGRVYCVQTESQIRKLLCWGIQTKVRSTSTQVCSSLWLPSEHQIDHKWQNRLPPFWLPHSAIAFETW